MKYSVRLVDSLKETSYLTCKGKTEWSRHTAKKHLIQFLTKFPSYRGGTIEPNN